MSLLEPEFGEVFRYSDEDKATVDIMWIGPSPGPFEMDWLGMQINEGTGWFHGFIGEVLSRVPLADGPFARHWSKADHDR